MAEKIVQGKWTWSNNGKDNVGFILLKPETKEDGLKCEFLNYKSQPLFPTTQIAAALEAQSKSQ